MKPSVIYVEDLLKKENFTLEELRKAKHKHPKRSWFKRQKFYILDFFHFNSLRLKLWLARNHLPFL